jgi:type I restriction enzyme R subunit
MESTLNQEPEQRARDQIDQMLRQAGWLVYDKNQGSPFDGKGVAMREYQTEVGPVDYALFVDGVPVGVIEAKREEEGHRMTAVEEQSRGYAEAAWKYVGAQAIPFIYESTGTLTRFTDRRDPKPRARRLFSFHRPETLADWAKQKQSLRTRLEQLPALNKEGLRPAQIVAIENLEKSFAENRPRALIQMATGAGKTYTAATFIYRLLRHANAQRILFLVDTKNLGEQAEQEFRAYRPKDDNRQFTELYNVQRLTSSYIAPDSQVCISTIQRLYSILKGEELDEQAEQENPNESSWLEQQRRKKEPLPVVYNERVPIEQFDFIVIDECHRSIYNLWQQVLDYFDAFQVGLTATPDKRTFGYFNENVVSEYTYEDSVADGVNVGYEIYLIDTAISQGGGVIQKGWDVERREKLSRRKRWEQQDEDLEYSRRDLDKKVVNPSQIRNVIRAFKRALETEIFPGRFKNGKYQVPKTLIFAKTDSHADDIIRVVREEFAEGNEFCKKVTYKIDEDPKSLLSRFRNDYYPRIAVTVDMIATGTDVKPLEVLLFMRDVKSSNYFTQMMGRGTRTIHRDDLQEVSSAAEAKTHFIIVDAVGVTKTKKTNTRPLERKRGVPLKDLLGAIRMGVKDEDLFLSLANRLSRLDKQLTEKEKAGLRELTGGKDLPQMTRDLLHTFDPDVLEQATEQRRLQNPGGPSAEVVQEQVQQELARKAASNFSGEVNDYLEQVRKVHEQIIDTHNLDTVTQSEWDKESASKSQQLAEDFAAYLEAHKDEITALRLFYGQPYQRRELTFRMVSELLDRIKQDQPTLAPYAVWDAYAKLDKVQADRPRQELVALVSLVRRVCGLDEQLTPYPKTVDKKFQDWVFRKQAGALKFSEEQMQWLRMIKDHIAGSFHLEMEDLDYTPFDAVGGRGRMYQLFQSEMDAVIEELNEVLVA